ncbi:MAG: nickel pincer cofactor biosynthesis protein LarB, partial [Bacteroidales bacterium]|nr:nickel pincer cofactor biosynthesis protein LarB [Bacteroidales bacterium]
MTGRNEIKKLLDQLSSGKISTQQALNQLSDLPFKDLGHTKVDNHRELRTGYPEVVFCEGKMPDQVRNIMEYMYTQEVNILGTRANREIYDAVREGIPAAEYNELGRTITLKQVDTEITKTYIAVLTAGTSDMPVAEEAATVAEFFGNKVKRYFDVGVAGIHRLYDNLDEIKQARVIIVIAGMEGALPSIVGGLVDKPIIAVPTSIGYGASFNGLAALLGMLTSCAAGISVVNIDNGFGAAYMASMINKI